MHSGVVGEALGYDPGWGFEAGPFLPPSLFEHPLLERKHADSWIFLSSNPSSSPKMPASSGPCCLEEPDTAAQSKLHLAHGGLQRAPPPQGFSGAIAPQAASQSPVIAACSPGSILAVLPGPVLGGP